ncbi:MAG: PKD domain-containing protein, partial [Bacteroidota bacterium]
MINTQGFQIVTELTENALLSVMQAAWKSGGDDSGEGVLPEKLPIPAGTTFGPLTVRDGFVQFPQEEVQINLNPSINGIDLTLGAIIHMEMENPPVESATFFDITADILINAPIGNPDESQNLALLLSGLPADAITMNITSGNPLDPVLDNAAEEYIHQLYQENGATFPHLIEDIPINVGPFSMLASVRFFDDESDLARRISVAYPDPAQVQINIPTELRFYDIEGDFSGFSLASPMAVLGRTQITADYVREPDRIAIALSTADVQFLDISPAPGTEGSNYALNRDLVDLVRSFNPTVPSLDDAIATGFQLAAGPFVSGLPDVDFSLPTLAELESMMAAQVRAELEMRRFIMIWEPDTADSEFSVENVRAQVLPDVLAIAVNGNDDANADALVNFIPGGCDFAIGLDAPFINNNLDEAIAAEFPSLPTRLPIEDREINLNSIDGFLINNCLRLRGEITVVDAILGSIDVDGSFTADFDLVWVNTPGGGQTIEPRIKGDPDLDIDLPFFAWLLSFLLGLFTFGALGGVISVVILAVLVSIVESLGGGILRDEITDELVGIKAFPDLLTNIGEVEALFKNPIDIFSSGLILRGQFAVESYHALTLLDFADSNGPYVFEAGQEIDFNGGAEEADSEASWFFGDGNNSSDRNPAHTYGDSGLYIAKLQVAVNQSGGATTRHFTAVKMRNQPPSVQLGPPFTVNEGESLEIVGSFTDPEWLDTHRAWFDFGDNTKPVETIVTETNEAPAARGIARAEHTYCDNGEYTVRLIVQDDDGGVGEATTKILVRNLPPKVSLPEGLCVLEGQRVILQGSFTDPGWCDTHTATWEFGDCKKAQGIVEQSHEAPEGKGKVEVCHTYEKCGIYQLKLTVTDDDGGIGEAVTTVRVVKLMNPSMENGFHIETNEQRQRNLIANEWCAFNAFFPTLNKKALNASREVRFSPSEFICRDGQRTQQIDFRGAVQGGIYQQICTNKGWCYEFRAFYHLTEGSSGKARIGIDPNGGINPSNPEIVWIEGEAAKEWQCLSVRAIAESDQITLFLAAVDRDGGINTIFWDKASLCMIQVYDKEATADGEVPKEPCQYRCINFEQISGGPISSPIPFQGLEIIPLGPEVYRTTIGEPAGINKLGFPPQGIRINFPVAVNELRIRLNNYAGDSLEVETYNGTTLLNAYTERLVNEVKAFTYTAANMTGIVIKGGDYEASVIEICLCLNSNQMKTLRS